MENILLELAKVVPVIAVLILVIYWLKAQYKKKEEEIIALNSEIKELSKENLNTLYKVLSFFEKLEDKNKDNHDAVLEQIKALKLDLIERINSIT